MPSAPALSLRPFDRDDVPFFTALAQDERVVRYVGDGRPWGEEVVRRRVAAALDGTSPVGEGEAVRWFVATELARRVALLVSSRRPEGVEIGYWVDPAAWGRGVAGALVARAVLLLREVHGPEPLIARVDPANVASAKVLLRGGFRRTGTSDGMDVYRLEPPAAVTPRR